MKFTLPTAVVLLASLGAVFAQDTSVASGTAASSQTTATSSSSSSSMTSSASEDSGSGGSAATSAPVATCTLFSGDPDYQPFGCPEGATTSTPPYNSISLQDYQIDAYSPGKEGVDIGAVASEMAKTVTEAYPTLTVPYGYIVDQYEAALSASATNFVPDSAVGSFTLPAGLSSFIVVAVAAVAGGAFIL